MNAVLPSISIESETTYPQLLRLIEKAGRVCYKSENLIDGNGSAEKFIKGIISRGHEAVLEHGTITVKVVCDRGVTHEIVRHRIGAYCQESTRYCNYSKDKFGNEISCVIPAQLIGHEDHEDFKKWKDMMEATEAYYMNLLSSGWTPQEARAVLPNSLKTEIFVTYNIREWRHFLKLRASKAAHPDMQVVAKMILATFKELFPLFFEDIEVE